MPRRRLFLLLLSFSLLAGPLVACAPQESAPQQIAAYPHEPQGDWYLPAGPAGGHLVYDAYLALEVPDPEAASAEAMQIARDYGGYLVNSYTSYAGSQPSITLELRVPPQNFESARWSLRTLGVLVRETISGEWEGGRPDWERYAQITLFLEQKEPSFSLRGLVDWHPGETLRRALAVSARLLGTLADGLIWVLVVVGPFALLGWLITWFARRGRGPRAESGRQNTRAPEHRAEEPTQGEKSNE